MKVLLINGSPRPHGCTYTALKEAEKALNEAGIETEIFHIGAKAIQGCTDCGACAGGTRFSVPFLAVVVSVRILRVRRVPADSGFQSVAGLFYVYTIYIRRY